MKSFWSVFWAILAAAAVLAGIALFKHRMDAAAAARDSIAVANTRALVALAATLTYERTPERIARFRQVTEQARATFTAGGLSQRVAVQLRMAIELDAVLAEELIKNHETKPRR